MTYAPRQSDSFNRSDRALASDTPDNALGGTDTGLWLDQIGAAHGSEIVSNHGVNTDSPAGGVHVTVSQAAPATDCRVTGVCYGIGTTFLGVVARFDTSTQQHYLYGGTTAASAMYYYDGAAYNSILGGGPGIADTNSIALVPNGATVTAYKNGSVAIASQPATQIASGKYGFYSEGGGAGFDSILYEIGTPSSTPTQLIVATQPAGNQSGVAFPTQPVVNVADAGASTVTTDTSTVSVALIGVTGTGTLGGTATKAAVAGAAAFSGLSVTATVPGSFKLRFTGGSLTLADSAVFYVGATQLVITSVSTPTYSKHPTTVVVTAKDAGGTVVANYTGTVALSINKLSGAGSVATLDSASSAAAVAGVATLTPTATTSDNGLVATSFTYTAAASGLTSATTATITPTVSESIAVTIT